MGQERIMTDIHCHILPGVDDGSWNMEMSKNMLTLAYVQGVRTIFATPHSFALQGANYIQVQQRFRELSEYIHSTPLDLRLYQGCEIRCEQDNIDAVLLYLKSGRYPTMNGSHYVLTEFRFSVLPEEALLVVQALRKENWIPVIAHIERYSHLFWQNPETHPESGKSRISLDVVNALLEQNCLLQVNASSLENQAYGQHQARLLLREQKIAFLGSDAHNTTYRPPSIKEGLRYVYETCSPTYAEALAFQNAEKRFISAPSRV